MLFSRLGEGYKFTELDLCLVRVHPNIPMHHSLYFLFFIPPILPDSPLPLTDLHFLYYKYTLPKWLGKSIQSFFPGQRDSLLIPNHTREIQSLIFKCPISMLPKPPQRNKMWQEELKPSKSKLTALDLFQNHKWERWVIAQQMK